MVRLYEELNKTAKFEGSGRLQRAAKAGFSTEMPKVVTARNLPLRSNFHSILHERPIFTVIYLWLGTIFRIICLQGGCR